MTTIEHNSPIYFRLRGVKPGDLGLDRLQKYIAVIGELVGDASKVHLTAIRSGSVKLVLVPEPAYRGEMVRRVSNAHSRGAADAKTRRAITRLHELLIEDRSPGADFLTDDTILLRLRGYTTPEGEPVGPVVKHHALRGIVVGLEGKDKSKHARVIEHATGREFPVEIGSLELAETLKPYLWTNQVIELRGPSRWMRHADGEWELKRFVVEGVEPLDAEPLGEALLRLREAHQGSDWSGEGDPIAAARKLRG